MRTWKASSYPLVLASVLLLFSATGVVADELGGRIRGTVSDPSGALIPGAKITATNIDTGISKEIHAQDDGSYEFLVLPAPATYNVSAEQPGFKTFQVSSIRLNLNQIYVLDIVMELGMIAQQVTVEAHPAQVEKTSMQLGADLTGSQLVDLPLNGRDWIQLQQTLPGVVASLGDFPDNFSTNGARAQSNDFLINGIDANDLILNVPLQIPSPDAIGEVHMITSTINPEFGRDSGAILNAVIKSGTNKFHGDGFEFYRDPFLNTRNFFLPQREQFHQNQFGGTVGGPIWKNHTFFFFSYEGTKNRLPIQPGRGLAGGTTPVFTQDQRNGIFPDLATSTGVSEFPLGGYAAGTPYSTIFPTGHIPAADLNPVSVNLVNKYMPLPNFGANEFSWNPITTGTNHQYITRIDHNFGTRDSIFGYWLIEPQKAQDDEPFFGGSLPGFAEKQTARVQHYTLDWSHTFGSTAVNEVRVGYNRFNFVTVLPVTPVQPSSVGFTGINPQSTTGAGIPLVQVNGFIAPTGGGTFGFSVEGPQPRIDQTYQVTDNLSKTVGRHTLKFGFEMRRAQVDNPFYFYNNGGFGFFGSGPFSTHDAGADFLLGIPDSYTQSSGGFTDVRAREYYSYAQDQYKILPNLTLTYGLGWEIDTPQTDLFNHSVAVNAFRPGQQSTVFPSAPSGLAFPGDKGISASSLHTHYNHLGPRAGFAWSPGNSQKLSIHGGVGIYYSVSAEELSTQNLLAPPFALFDFGIGDASGVPSFATPFSGYTPVLNSAGTQIIGSTPVSIPNKYPFYPPKPGTSNLDFSFFEPFTLNVMDPNFQTPVSYNYNLTAERELPGDMILTLAYVGLQARHLETRYELNPAGSAPGVNPTCAANGGCVPTNIGSTVPSSFRYPQTNSVGSLIFGSVGQQATDANSNYNSFQATLTKHLSHGVSFRTVYTWSHSLDPISSFEDVGGNGAPNPFNLHQNYGDSAFDARHRFVFSYSYDLPSVRRFSAFERLPSRLTDGWRLNGATGFQTGFPVGLLDSSNNSLICYSLASKYGCPDRPNVLRATALADPRHTSFVNLTQGAGALQDHYYFDPNAFSPEARGVLGNAGRNFFHGPGINNFDFGLYKDTKVTERTRIELRFEFFNLFNHAQFNNPVGDINDPNFGRVLSAAPPRIIQLAAKFYF